MASPAYVQQLAIFLFFIIAAVHFCRAQQENEFSDNLENTNEDLEDLKALGLEPMYEKRMRFAPSYTKRMRFAPNYSAKRMRFDPSNYQKRMRFAPSMHKKMRFNPTPTALPEYYYL